MAIVTPQERVGTTLEGKYRLDRILGEGGFGVVFAASHIGLERPVAIKMLHRHLSDQADIVSRFLREARATSTLNHPNVIDVRDVVLSPENGVYMVLELLEGETLSSLLARKVRLSLAETMECVAPILDAMCAAHEAGIVHRDLKPDNIFLSRTPDGQMIPKLLDFGIAKLADAGRAMATATGMVLGTPVYMSPEQAMGRTKEIGPLADVWSMAVVLYECLAGSFPFDLPAEPTATAVVLEVVTGRIVPLSQRCPSLPPRLSRTLAQALDRDVGARLPSMRALTEAMREALGEDAPAVTARQGDHVRLPPTLVATGPLAVRVGAAVADATREVAQPAARLAPASQRTGPMPGSMPVPNTPTEHSISTSTARMFAQLREPSRIPTWAWATAALAALVGTIVMWTLTLRVAEIEAATPAAPRAEPTVSAPEVARVVSPPPVPVAVAVPEPAAPVRPEAPSPSSADEAPVVTARERAARTTPPESARPSVAAVVPTPRTPETTTPPPVSPPEVRPPPPVPPTPGVTHRASTVSIDDF